MAVAAVAGRRWCCARSARGARSEGFETQRIGRPNKNAQPGKNQGKSGLHEFLLKL